MLQTSKKYLHSCYWSCSSTYGSGIMCIESWCQKAGMAKPRAEQAAGRRLAIWKSSVCCLQYPSFMWTKDYLNLRDACICIRSTFRLVTICSIVKTKCKLFWSFIILRVLRECFIECSCPIAGSRVMEQQRRPGAENRERGDFSDKTDKQGMQKKHTHKRHTQDTQARHAEKHTDKKHTQDTQARHAEETQRQETHIRHADKTCRRNTQKKYTEETHRQETHRQEIHITQ